MPSELRAAPAVRRVARRRRLGSTLLPAAVATLLACVLGACSHHAKRLSAEAVRYEHDIAAANKVWTDFVSYAQGWPGGLPPSDAASRGSSVRSAWQSLNDKLLAERWPGDSASAVRALVAADQVVLADLARLGSLPSGQATAWSVDFIDHVAGERAAADRVRVALGLPALA